MVVKKDEILINVFKTINKAINLDNLVEEIYNLKAVELFKKSNVEIFILLPDIFIKRKKLYHILVGNVNMSFLQIYNIENIDKDYKGFSSTSYVHTYFMKKFIFNKSDFNNLKIKDKEYLIISTIDKTNMLKYLNHKKSSQRKVFSDFINNSDGYFSFTSLFRGWYFKNDFEKEYNNVKEFFEFLELKSKEQYIPKRNFKLTTIYNIIWQHIFNMDNIVKKIEIPEIKHLKESNLDLYEKYNMILNALMVFCYLKGNQAE